MRLRRVVGLAVALCLLAAAFPAAWPGAQAAAKYYITVDLTNQIVTVYRNGNTTKSGIVRQMICSTGKSGTPTPTGTYTLPSKKYSTERREWYYFPAYNCYAKWATRIVGGILFHSVLYSASKKGPTQTSVSALGSKASHGCVRLRVPDAKWIAQNCPTGTRCRIYKSGKTNAALRRRLLKKSFSRSTETYDHYMGRSASDDGGEDSAALLLAKGSAGEQVKQLQKRLKALGFLNGSVDGKFGSVTEGAVKYFQSACGLKKTGEVDDALWARIFEDSAPTGTYVTLSKGMSGPAVAALQRALAALRLYDGAADGSYDAETVASVKRFQRAFDYAVNGKANSALQKDMIQRADALGAEYGDAAYRLVSLDETVDMARVKGKSTVPMRAKAKSGAKALAQLKKKTEVLVLSRGKSWTKVRYNRKNGYIQTKYLTFFKGTRETLSYAPDDGQSPEPEPTQEPEVYIPTPEPSQTPEISIPTPEPTPTPEVYIPTPEPEDGVTTGEAQAAEDARNAEEAQAVEAVQAVEDTQTAGEMEFIEDAEAAEASQTVADAEKTQAGPAPEADGAMEMGAATVDEAPEEALEIELELEAVDE